jgi:hypothetical protein
VRLVPFGNNLVIMSAVFPTVGQVLGTRLPDAPGDSGSVLFRPSPEHALIRTTLANTAAHQRYDDRNILCFLRNE